MTSETPRTEAAETRANASTNPYSVLREHARDLERKLAEAMDRSQEDWVALTQRAERAETKLAALQATPDVAGLVERIRAYLCMGGLWNPDLANHDAVRDLIIDCRDALLPLSAQLSAAQAECEGLRQDAERYRWLVEDHENRETRKYCRELLNRIGVMSYSAASTAIDSARARKP